MRGEFIDLGGARLYCFAAGSRGAGVPIVFLHGFPTSSHLWMELGSRLPQGHRFVVVDLLGYGRSDRAAGRDVSVKGHGERTVALFDALGINHACLVGHDLGGGIAQWIATRHPARVSHLCLIDSVAFDGWPIREVKLARAMLPLTRSLPPSWLLSMVRADLLRGYADSDRGTHSIAQYLRPFGTNEGHQCLLEHLMALDCAETVALEPRLRQLVQPTSIIWGAEDPWLPEALGRRLQATIPGATLDVLPGVRHFTPEESPEQIAARLVALIER